MTVRLMFGSALAAWALAACQQPPSPDARLQADGVSAQDAGVDPIVAHFFNTAALAQADVAVIVQAANTDGGANADAGN
jgi:predicted dienelactone hydrolase